ncbi:MAG: serine acetyltransferase [Peptococcaceae bacterium]|jgi:serine O-acetyltransferase|nr:serine acetyltransferase [Peptococcaceae bacterium]
MANGQKQEGDISDLVAAVIASYESGGGAELSGIRFLPDKAAVIDCVELLRRLLFPGYFAKDEIDAGHREYYVGDLLYRIRRELRRQICCAFNYGAGDGANCHDMSERADAVCQRFLERIPAARETLLTDAQATYDGDPAARGVREIIFAYPGIFAITVYRLAHALHLLEVPLIPRIMTEYAHSLTGIDIHPGAEIGHHFFIDHGTGIVIGETTEIGANVKIYQNVTLGALSTRGGQSFRGKKRHPTLEDEVTVYAGASILGGETVIGKGSVIGSNAFITQSVPPFTRVSIKHVGHDFKERDNLPSL